MNPTTSTPTASTPTASTYVDGTWVEAPGGKVRACFEYIGEGYNGDYDETDPTDAPLYRLDINVAAEYAEATYAEDIDDDPDWFYPADGSICTAVRMDDIDEETALILLGYAAETIDTTLLLGGGSVKGAMDRLSLLPDLR